MKWVWCLVIPVLAGCDSDGQGPDAAAPAASNIPRAAASARGADYPRPLSGVRGEAADAGAGGGAGTGLKICDDYVAAAKRCAKTMPPSSGASFEEAAKQLKKALASAPPSSRQQYAEACQNALDAIRIACP